MHKLAFDDTGSLELQYQQTGDYATDWDIDGYLKAAKFEEITKNDSQITYVLPKSSNKVLVFKTVNYVINYFEKIFGKNSIQIDDNLKNELYEFDAELDLYDDALRRGVDIKNKNEHNPKLSSSFKRELLPFQKESVEHILAVENAANFSVPGSGKTTMAYAAIASWLDSGKIEKIMVIGPTASFAPWEEEYQHCFGKKPLSLRVRGDRAELLENIGNSYDLFVLHYQTANSKRMELVNFLRKYKTVLIIDESHNIKSPELGKWASAALFLAPYAKRRIILSGTPIPNDYRDLWTQITFLWPQNFPLGNQIRYNYQVQKRGLGQEYRHTLDGLFCRIMKDDLHLPDPKFIPVMVDIGPIQRKIYNVIAAKTLEEIESLADQARLHKFRIARMVRLLQTASNPSLLLEKSTQFDVNHELFGEEFGMKYEKYGDTALKELSVYDEILNYSKREIPSKLVEAHKRAKKILDSGEKIIIWSSFLLNMYIFQEQLFKEYDPIIINGSVSRDPKDHPNRDELIKKFKNSSEPEIIIATAASLGESVSLHKNLNRENVCSHAIYLDRNFNGAQYMQSVDRIHRIGMDPNLEVEYHLLIGKKTIDERIHTRLIEKWTDMTNALNDPFVARIDFDVYSENQSEDEFDKDYRSLVEHLREVSRN